MVDWSRVFKVRLPPQGFTSSHSRRAAGKEGVSPETGCTANSMGLSQKGELKMGFSLNQPKKGVP